MNWIYRILLRWSANSLGLWIAGRLIGGVDHGDSLAVIIIAGLVLSLVNTLIKPLVVILSLPAILLSLGLFVVIINGFMVWLAANFVGDFEVATFGAAVLAGLVIGLVNYVVTMFLD